MIKRLIRAKYKMLALCITVGVLFVSCSSDSGNDNDTGNTNNTDGVSSSCSTNIKLPEIALGVYVSTGGDGSTSETATIIASDSELYTINFNNDVTPLTNISLCGVELEDLDGTIFLRFNFEGEGISINIISTDSKSSLIILKLSNPMVSFSGEK